MNITHGLRRALQINPNGLASVFGNRRRNWREIGERVPRLAAGLRSLGANPGERVAILSQNSDRYIELYLATAWAGAVVVPLNIRWSPVENEDAMRDCRANILVVDKAFASVGTALGESPARVEADLRRRRRCTGRHGKLRDAAASERTCSGCDAYRQRPRRHLLHRRHHRPLKGCHAQPRQSHGQFPELPWGRPLPGSAIYLHAAPMFHLANGAAMYSLLLSGGSNVIIPAFTPEAVMFAVQNERVTDVLLVPTMIQMLVDHSALGSYDLSSLKKIIYGASPISEAVMNRATVALPNVQFTQAYGMTELSPMATVLHWKEHIGEGRAKGRHRGAGRATLGCEVRIVDPDNKPVPQARSVRSSSVATMS